MGRPLGGAEEHDPWDWNAPETPKARKNPGTRKTRKRTRHTTDHTPEGHGPTSTPPNVPGKRSVVRSEAEESRSNQGSDPAGDTDTDTAGVLGRRIDHPSDFDETGGSGDDGAAGIVEDPEEPPGAIQNGVPVPVRALWPVPVPYRMTLDIRENPNIHKAPRLSSAS